MTNDEFDIRHLMSAAQFRCTPPCTALHLFYFPSDAIALLSAFMSWLDKLERRFGFIAIPGLIRIIVGFNALVYLLVWLNPDFLSILDLDPVRIRHGEVWRLVTYIFIPQSLNPLWVLFALLFLWWIGNGLEHALGAFRLTLYFLIGMIGTTCAAFFFGTNFSNTMLIASLFYAFARFYPDEVIYVMLILPLKVKWIAWILGALLIGKFFIGSNGDRMAIVASLSNYLIFFGPTIIHEARHRQEVSERRRRFETGSRTDAEPIHICAACGATELTDPNLEFRVARNGEEYCMAHLPAAAPQTR